MSISVTNVFWSEENWKINTSEAAKYIEDLKESGVHFSEKNLKVNIASDFLSSIADV